VQRFAPTTTAVLWRQRKSSGLRRAPTTATAKCNNQRRLCRRIISGQINNRHFHSIRDIMTSTAGRIPPFSNFETGETCDVISEGAFSSHGRLDSTRGLNKIQKTERGKSRIAWTVASKQRPQEHGRTISRHQTVPGAGEKRRRTPQFWPFVRTCLPSTSTHCSNNKALHSTTTL